MSFIFVGNWKMNPVSSIDAKNLFGSYKKIAKKFARRKISLVACPSAPHLGLFLGAKKPKNLFLGAQDAFFEKSGAFTGEISPVALYGVGANYLILGHSERRRMGENIDAISKKIKLALKTKFTVIVCVGEQQRDSEGEFWHQLRSEIEDVISNVSKNDLKNVIIAYEPVWAVGEESKGAMSGEDLRETVLFIKKVVSQNYFGNVVKSLKVLYGGSVLPENARNLKEVGGVNGFLVGRESLIPKEIERILDEIS